MTQQAAEQGQERQEQLVIDDLDTLKALAEPLRLRIHTEMTEGPRTVKELAGLLDVPQTRLYYHVKILERHGLIRVASRRVVSGIEERTYEATARSTTVSTNLLTALAGTGAIKALLDMTAAELEVALSDPATQDDPEIAIPLLTGTRLFLSPDEVRDVQLRVFDGIIGRYSDPSRAAPGRSEYSALFVGYRLNRPSSS